ncbi:MAG TPA: hypothetical protein DDX71_05825 [Ruminococcus sp.]|nr:hypothetical protein [Ruminococcus sp.]
MKNRKYHAAAALLAAFLMFSASALPCAAADTTAAETTSAAETTETTASAAETEAADDDAAPAAGEGETALEGPDEDGIFTSANYRYTVLTNSDNADEKVVQVETYIGSDTDVVIPSEIDGLPVCLLGDRAFASAHNLKTVTIPKTVTGLGTYAFAACDVLTEFRVESGNTFCESRDGVLYSADGLTLLRYPLGKSPVDLEIEEGVTGIDNVAFANCPTLKSIKLPESVEYIGASAFASCFKLETINLPHNLTAIEPFTFNSCTALTSIIIPANVREIGSGAFAGTGLTGVTLPDSCITIGEQAFAATKLKEVTIPSSVSDIGYTAFGWNIVGDELVMDPDFVIRGYAGSAAETYAHDEENGSGFTFVELEAPSQPATNPPAADTTGSKTGAGRIIGIIGCCAALAGLAGFAVISGISKKKSGSSDAADASEPDEAASDAASSDEKEQDE